MDLQTPKHTLDSFEVKSNFYVVEQDGKFHYFPFKALADDPDAKFLTMDRRPPVLLSGKAIVSRVVYEVSIKELMRGIINKQSIISGRPNANAKRSKPKSNGVLTVASELRYSDKQGLSGDDLLEVNKAADAAWEEQASSLLQTLYSKEGCEWEVTNTPQP